MENEKIPDDCEWHTQFVDSEVPVTQCNRLSKYLVKFHWIESDPTKVIPLCRLHTRIALQDGIGEVLDKT